MFGKEAREHTKHGSPPSQMVREKEGQASFHFLSGRVLGVKKGAGHRFAVCIGIV